MYLQSNIQYLLDLHKLNPNEAAPIIGIPQPTLFRIHGGITKEPKRETLDKLAEWSGFDSNDLINKDLRIEINKNTVARRTDDGSTIEMLDPRPVIAWDGKTPLDKDEIAAPFFKDFPISCGEGTIGEAVLQNEHRRLRLSKSTLRSYGVDPNLVIVVTANGNSNYPEIKHKATVYMELRRENVADITDGCFYEICHDGVHFLKKLYSLPGGGVRVVSVNKEEWEPYDLTKEQIEKEKFTIEGYAFDVQNPLPRR